MDVCSCSNGHLTSIHPSALYSSSPQNRFGWLSATGYAQWCIQALDLNPSDLPAGYIAQIRSAADEYLRHNSGSGMDVNSNVDADVNAYGEMDNGAVPVLPL